MLCLYKNHTAFLVLQKDDGDLAFEQLSFVMSKVEEGYKAFYPRFNDPTIFFSLIACLKGIDVEDTDRHIERSDAEVDLANKNILVCNVERDSTDSRGSVWYVFTCIREYKFCVIDATSQANQTAE